MSSNKPVVSAVTEIVLFPLTPSILKSKVPNRVAALAFMYIWRLVMVAANLNLFCICVSSELVVDVNAPPSKE